MKFEFSAGGIVYKRQTMQNHTQNNAEDILILVAQHSGHHGWVFPKGHIGDTIQGEKKEETAVREVEEETGVLAKIVEPLPPVTYWYVLKKEKIKKTVYYFLMKYLSVDSSKKDEEMEQVEWLPIDEVENRLTYPSDKDVWQEAKKHLESITKSV